MLNNGTIILKLAKGAWQEYPKEHGTVCADSLPGEGHEMILLGLSCESETEENYEKMERSNEVRVCYQKSNAKKNT